MKKFRTLSAIFAAMVLAGSIGAVSAAEENSNVEDISIKTAEEKAFIESFENQDLEQIASFYIDGGLSIEESSSLMDVYMEGLAEIAESSVTGRTRSGGTVTDGPYYTNTNFYSGTKLSANQHRGIVIADNASANTTVNLALTFDPQWVTIDNNDIFDKDNINGNLRINFTPALNMVSMSGNFFSNIYSNVPAGVLTLPFDVVSVPPSNDDAYCEATLYHKFTFSRLSSNPSTVDTTFSFETYVLGDVNHDGRVSAADCTYLSNLLSHKITNLSFIYTDKSANKAKIVNDLAQDANRDGKVDVTDISCISIAMGNEQ